MADPHTSDPRSSKPDSSKADSGKPDSGKPDSGVARNGEVELAYEVFGQPAARPLLLINGLDGQMIGWDGRFVAALVAAGFQVVRYDQRDTGLSTSFSGRKRAYEFTDLIDDMMAVLDAVGWESANLAGLSSGGGIAQYAALLRPGRVRTLTLISAVPQYGNQFLLFRYIRFPGPFKLVFRRYGDTAEDKKRMLMDVARMAGSKSLPLDEEWLGQVAEESVRRRYPDPHSRARQLAAGRTAKMPKGGIAKISQPVLAINGDEDPFVRPAAGRKIAETVPHGRFVLVHGMGHVLSAPLFPEVVTEIDRLAR
jgi:pimeloyl-ACP methyl ester carboxylesterase